MQRNFLLSLLQAYHPEDVEEKHHKRAIEAFVKRCSNCFERSCEEGHITASSWLLSEDLQHAFLLHHAKLGIWCQPGGHCDGEPDVVKVAIKEALEESGLQEVTSLQEAIFDVDVHLIPQSPKEKAHLHYDIRFLLKAVGNQTIILNHESKDFLWVGKEGSSLPSQERSIHRMHRKWREKK